MWGSLWYLGISIPLLFVLRKLLKMSRGKVDKNNEISVSGKIVLITGGTRGIGRSAALEFAYRNANIILACRNKEQAKGTIAYIRSKTSRGQLTLMELDLASLSSVRNFADEFKSKYDKIDILVNNAGLLLPPEKRLKTKDGFEMHFGVNHLGHFLLTNLLLEPLKNAAPSRIVTVGSMAHSWGSINFNDLMSEKAEVKSHFLVSGLYSNSKLANALFSKELAKRLSGSGVRTYCLCPGAVFTDIGRDLKVPFIMHLLGPVFWFFLRSPEEGASTILYCALNKTLGHETGQMYQNCKYWDQKSRIELLDKDATELWSASERLTGLSK